MAKTTNSNVLRPLAAHLVVRGVVGMWRAGKWAASKVDVKYVRKIGKGILILSGRG